MMNKSRVVLALVLLIMTGLVIFTGGCEQLTPNGTTSGSSSSGAQSAYVPTNQELQELINELPEYVYDPDGNAYQFPKPLLYSSTGTPGGQLIPVPRQ